MRKASVDGVLICAGGGAGAAACATLAGDCRVDEAAEEPAVAARDDEFIVPRNGAVW